MNFYLTIPLFTSQPKYLPYNLYIENRQNHDRNAEEEIKKRLLSF
ncbi:hypothetical protein SAMN03080601_01466 [Alkalitalea saponilacus]|uniref:Uncharacterized protein n=1 Tax=Alkalitalea saponilacus TaxID=889453 RepID=A0A1T5EYV7_9BACT|nr:hypothetical protein SAMN03080601_01466 [Alkalitalea saponilacus]